jgi:hypothetical protein
VQYWLSKATLDSGNAAAALTLIEGAFGDSNDETQTVVMTTVPPALPGRA